MKTLSLLKIAPICLFLTILTIDQSLPNRLFAAPTPFQKGDVFLSDNTSVRHYNSLGTLLDTLPTGAPDNDQCAFDSTGQLYVTNPSSVIRFSGPDVPHTNLGAFGSVSGAEPIIFDVLGNVYVGVEDTIAPFIFLYKFDKTGKSLAQFAPNVEFSGIAAMDLASDQKTLFYTSDGKRIMRYDLETETQLPDLVPILPGSYSGGLRLLPDESLLVTNAEFILRLDSAGNEMKRYDADAVNAWYSLSIDPDGTSFWARSEDSTKLFKFEIATGNVLLSPDITGDMEGSLCVFGEVTVSTLDTDGDALPDYIETNGYDATDQAGRPIHVNLLGATKDRKDIYVYVDWLEVPGNHSHKPNQAAIDRVIKAFADAPVDCDGAGQNCKGVNLHVQFGSSIAETTGSSGNQELGTLNGEDYVWQEFDTIKSTSFPNQFLPAYHYVIFGHDVPGYTGVSRGFNASDFTIGLGKLDTESYLLGTKTEIWAGVFMHELGHNLGLGHGGVKLSANGRTVEPEHTMYKPNHLSVMNYSFVGPSGPSFGLSKSCRIFFYCDGVMDYSRFGSDALPDLIESGLSENTGIRVSDIAKDYLTYYYCPGDTDHRKPQSVEPNQSVDWNCDDAVIVSPIGQTADINQDMNFDTLRTVNEWRHLVYKGGAVGAFGPPINLPEQTEVGEGSEFTVERLIANSTRDALLIGLVIDRGVVEVGEMVTYVIRIASNTDTDLSGIVISNTLPTGFIYQPGSTMGATISDPIITGRTLVYAGPFTVGANDILAISFKVTSSNTPGTYLSSAQASGANIPLVQTGNTAQVIVATIRERIHLPLMLKNSLSTSTTATPIVLVATPTAMPTQAPTNTPSATPMPMSTPTNIPPTPTHTPTLPATNTPTPTATQVAPIIQFSSASFKVNENGGSASIQVSLSTASTQIVSVNYATSSGTATAGNDYTTATGTMTFNPGVISQFFTMPVIDDTLAEPDETITLLLSNPSNAILGTLANTTLVIRGNDNPTTYSIVTDINGQKMIQVTSLGSIVSLANIKAGLGNANSNLLQDLGNGVWRLNANLFIGSNVILNISPDVGTSELQMRSQSSSSSQIDYASFVYLRTFDGIINLDGVSVYSWDTALNTFDNDITNGRAYLLAKYDAVMNIRNSALGYLGSADGESYGVSWRDINDPASPGVLRTRATGEVINSQFHHNYYGVYTDQASNILFQGNRFNLNIRYGFDCYNFSHHFIIENNEADQNGAHGFFISRGCNNLVVRNNRSYNNFDGTSGEAHGFVLDPGPPISIDPQAFSYENNLENNEAYGNEGLGLRILGSINNRILNNNFHHNRVGVIVDDKGAGNTIQGNLLQQNGESGLLLLENANSNIVLDNQISNNGNHGIYLRSNDNLIRNNSIQMNRLNGIYVWTSVVNGFVQSNQIISNTITGNMDRGVDLRKAQGTLLQGNIVADHINYGIYLGDGSNHNSIFRNTIRNNNQQGIHASGTQTYANTWSQNSIYANQLGGIALTGGANRDLTAPTLLRVTGLTIYGQTNPGATVEIFTDTAAQGQNFEGQTIAGQDGLFSFTLSGSRQASNLTAIAIDAEGNASTFSASISAPSVVISIDYLPLLIDMRKNV